ncbi:DUF1707 domain-containing protein [Streptomyces sp. XD-27]|uniref:DUF1707 SHOCT-like domain-containing protein n=1 Tax=Streptomyces sp. XD-27 TaxID=3062779 RepID=UPI0026F40FF2|nr:DUF1707 domain-containing protein [Streptomyces sp. XD-27]WKX72349.1 DUF1707 domain-containing protein [Streptomyces sp. XD-27]
MDEQKPAPFTKSLSEPVAEVDLRASDADRDRIADILREALAEGRIDPEEHAERIDAVYRARTRGELEPLIRDLPAAAVVASSAGSGPGSGVSVGYDTAQSSSGPARTGPASESLVAVFGGSVRQGRWRVRPRTNAFALFGGVEIDLTQAIFEQQEIVVNATAVFGGVEIKVPENVTVRGGGTGIFGGFDAASGEAEDPAAPVIVITGFALFGGVQVYRIRGKRLKNLRAG